MKKLIIMAVVAVGLVLGISVNSFASDWDKAGKAFAIIEGVRVLTGGAVDVIGTITGINRPREQVYTREVVYAKGDGHRGRFDRDDRPRGHAYGHDKHFRQCERRVWVPHYVWIEKYVPEHTEYRPGYGNVVVEGHYEKCQVEEGGHWEIIYERD